MPVVLSNRLLGRVSDFIQSQPEKTFVIRSTSRSKTVNRMNGHTNPLAKQSAFLRSKKSLDAGGMGAFI
jgi:hypothetical protein